MAGGRMWQVPPCDTLQLERNKISQNCQYIQIVWLMECLIFKTGYTRYSLRLLWWCRDRAAAPRVIRSHVPRVRTGQCRRWARPGEVGKWWHVLSFMQSMQSIHGIMGSPEPNWISQVRPPPDCKYTHSTTPRLCVIGCRVAVPCSHWSAVPTPLFIYISQLLRDSFFVSQQPPIWEPPSHFSMI